MRATQFHQLIADLFTAQRFLPVVFAPRLSFQPIDTADVAMRLAELAAGSPAGRVDDLGGPEQLTGLELARRWADAASARRAIVPLSLPGATFEALRAGRNLVQGTPYGTTTFAEYLASRYGAAAR